MSFPKAYVKQLDLYHHSSKVDLLPALHQRSIPQVSLILRRLRSSTFPLLYSRIRWERGAGLLPRTSSDLVPLISLIDVKLQYSECGCSIRNQSPYLIALAYSIIRYSGAPWRLIRAFVDDFDWFSILFIRRFRPS